jgi:hypothetical protein
MPGRNSLLREKYQVTWLDMVITGDDEIEERIGVASRCS